MRTATGNARPVALPIQAASIPRELVELNCWVFWKYEWKADRQKWDKPPYGAGSTSHVLKLASSSKPKTWLSLMVAKSWCERFGCDGVGFVVSKESPFTVIDLDGCINDREQIADWAHTIIELFAGTYMERSPSRTGIRIIVRGKLPLPPGRFGLKKTLPGEHCGFEVFDGNKYFTITGHKLPNAADVIADRREELTAWFKQTFAEELNAIEKERSARSAQNNGDGFLPDDETVLRTAYEAANGPKFRALYDRGDLAEYDGDDSSADMGLCRMLAFWCRKNRTVVDRLFRRSKLWRSKWDEFRGDTTYGWLTVDKAIAAQQDSYDWPTKSSEEPQIEPIRLTDQFLLQPVLERRTRGGKIVIQVKLMAGVQSLVLLEITSASSSQDAAARKLEKYIAAPQGEPTDGESQVFPGVDVTAVVGKLLCDAQERLARAAVAKSAEDDEDKLPTVRDIVFRAVPSLFELAYATEDGKLWSEAKARAVSRQEFCAFTPGWLVNACEDGRDAPADETSGDVDELRLVRMIQTSLGILWASLMENLPRQAAEANLNEYAEDAKRFWFAMVKLWTALTTHQVTTTKNADGDDETIASRASLASRVLPELKRFQRARRIMGKTKWLEVQHGFHAWWRPYAIEDGTIIALLGMKHTLCDQLRVALPGVTDPVSLRTLGERYGVTDDTPPVTERMSGGSRLVVLSPEIMAEILAEPTEPEEDNPHSDTECDSDGGLPVTEENAEEATA